MSIPTIKFQVIIFVKQRHLSKCLVAWLVATLALALPLISHAQQDESTQIGQLVERLGSEDLQERYNAEKNLKKLGASTLSVLIEVLKDQNRLDLEKRLPGLNTELEAAIRNRKVRQNVVELLKYHLHDAQDIIIPVLIEALGDPDPVVGKSSARILRGITPPRDDVLKMLSLTILNPKQDTQVRIAAADSLGYFGESGIPALKEALRATDDPAVRITVAQTLGRIGAPSVHVLIKALKDPDATIVLAAAQTLKDIGQAPQDVASALVRVLRDWEQDDEVRKSAAEVLGSIKIWVSDDVVSALILAVQDKMNEKVAESAARSLGSIKTTLKDKEEVIVSALIEALKPTNVWTVRVAAAESLEKLLLQEETMGDIRDSILHALIEALEDIEGSEGSVRQAVARILNGLIQEQRDKKLVEIKKDLRDAIVYAFIKALEDENQTVRLDAVRALGKVGTSTNKIMLPLIKVLNNKTDAYLRSMAAESLANLHPARKELLPHLIDRLNDEEDYVRISAAKALEVIADKLHVAKDTEAIDSLKRVAETLHRNPLQKVQQHAERVDWVVKHLESLKRDRRIKRFVAQVEARPWLIIFPTYILWIFFVILIYRFRPIYVLRLANVLQNIRIQLPGVIGGLGISVQYIFFVEFLKYKPRVLEDWVAYNLDTACERFEKLETVKHHKIHIPVTVKLEGNKVYELSGRDLRPIFDVNHAFCLLIRGEGGTGKTNLACQIARWAMEEDSTRRPCGHLMLPILIDHELDAQVEDPFCDAVSGALHDLIGKRERIHKDMLQALLQHRRLLVIIDHLSEMSETSRSLVKPAANNYSANAFIVTSRIKEPLSCIVSTELETLSFERDRLFSFMEAYLRRLGQGDRFDDLEFFEACAWISAMVGNRKTTVLLAKLYLEKIIGIKERGIREEPPETVPGVMLEYVNELNKKVPEGERLEDITVHRVARAVAWQCLIHTYRPSPTRIEDVIAEIDEDKPKDYLDYLVKRLQLVEIVPPAKDHVRFLLDPLAEYLAGRYLVTTYCEAADKWRQFLENADQMPGGPQAIKGFIQAVLDCCKAYGKDNNLPGFVIPELEDRLVAVTEV